MTVYFLFIVLLGDKLHYCDCKNEIIELLSNTDDVKIIIILLLIIMKLKYELDEDLQVKIRSTLLVEFNKCKNDNEKETIVKCLTVCVNNCIYLLYFNLLIVEIVKSIVNVTGDEIIYRLLNNKDNINSDLYNEILEYSRSKIENEEDYKNVIKIIKKDEIRRNLLTQQLTVFKYNQSEYSYLINDPIELKPECDGLFCHYTVTPDLPDGLIIDYNSGIISGKGNVGIQPTTFLIQCTNNVQCLFYNLQLEILDCRFTKNNKSSDVIIKNNFHVVTKFRSDMPFSYCFLNINLIESFKYEITYKSLTCGCIMFGITKSNNLKDPELYRDDYNSYTIRFGLNSGRLLGIGMNNNNSICVNEGTLIQNDKPTEELNILSDFKNYNGAIFKIIYDMKNKVIGVEYNNNKQNVIMFENVESENEVYKPFVVLTGVNDSIELISINKE